MRGRVEKCLLIARNSLFPLGRGAAKLFCPVPYAKLTGARTPALAAALMQSLMGTRQILQLPSPGVFHAHSLIIDMLSASV